MKDAIEMYNQYADETLDPHNDILYTDVELAIKRAVRKKDKKIDLNLFYELIEFASEIEHGPEDDHLNKSWQKAINNYLKKFYPKEKYYHSFTHENL